MSIKSKLLAVALASTFLASGIAAATEGFYVGGDIKAVSTKFNRFINLENAGFKPNDLKNKFGGSIFAGYTFSDAFGAEFGLDLFKKKTSEGTLSDGTVSTKYTAESKLYQLYIDGVFMMPINNDFDFLLTTGLGYMNPKLTIDSVGRDKSEFDKASATIRLGLGAQYKIDDNFGVRCLVRYHGIIGDSGDPTYVPGQGMVRFTNKHLDRLVTAELGATYSF